MYQYLYFKKFECALIVLKQCFNKVIERWKCFLLYYYIITQLYLSRHPKHPGRFDNINKKTLFLCTSYLFCQVYFMKEIKTFFCANIELT